MATPATRPMRADARRNRELILAAAREVFDAEGLFAPLDDVATRAGVGNATLYRNFPTRDDLLAAVIDDSILALVADSEDLETALPAREALAEWLFRLSWGLRVWHDLPTCVAAALDDDDSPVQPVFAPLITRTRELLQVAVDDGAAASTYSAEEVIELVTALSWAVDRFGDDVESARRRVVLGTSGLFVTSDPW